MPSERHGETTLQQHSLPADLRTRFDTILSHVPPASNRVLDVGCVRHSTAHRSNGNLHAELVDHVSGDVLGIDIVDEEVEKMAAQGYNVRVADAEALDLDGTFETIVAGEVIEHLANPGKFFKCARDHLTEDGKIVLSTPNPDGFAYFRKALTNASNSETHTCWIDPDQLRYLVELVDGLCLESIEFLPPTGGVSGLFWRVGHERVGSPTYVAVVRMDG